MTLYHKDATPWDPAQPINETRYPPNIGELWGKDQLAKIGLFKALEADPTPPEFRSIGQTVQMVNGVPKFVETLESTVTTAAQVRVERGDRFEDCDWTQLPDAPLTAEQKAAWAVYRQLLRDVTKQAGFPASVAWPPVPV